MVGGSLPGGVPKWGAFSMDGKAPGGSPGFPEIGMI
jgi:hypothetical protein